MADPKAGVGDAIKDLNFGQLNNGKWSRLSYLLTKQLGISERRVHRPCHGEKPKGTVMRVRELLKYQYM